jgi:hypothetical protein
MGVRIELKQQLTNAAPRDGVQVAGRFIRKQHRRLRNKRACKRDALLLSTGELAGIMSGSGAQPDTPKGIYSGASCVHISGQLQGQHDVFEGSQGRNQVK